MDALRQCGKLGSFTGRQTLIDKVRGVLFYMINIHQSAKTLQPEAQDLCCVPEQGSLCGRDYYTGERGH